MRRLFLLLALLSIAGCSAAESDAPALGDAVYRIGFVSAAGEAGVAARQGAELGAVEASRAGELVSVPFQLVSGEASTAAEAREQAERLADAGVFALVGGWEPAICSELIEVAQARELIYLNTGCRADELRQAASAAVFHVEASNSTRGQAGEEGNGSAPVAIWHPELFRYGAEQLNERFEDRFGRPFEEEAWASWMAVKVLWESALRLRTTDAERIARHLLDENTSFDGHKGRSLTFDAETHELRQPLYRLAGADGGPLEVEPAGENESPAARLWRELEGRPVPPGDYLVVSNEGSQDVGVIDITTGQPVSRIRVEARPRGIHAGSDGRHIYVALSDDSPQLETDQDGIAVIDLRRARVVDHIAAGTDPEQFAILPSGDFLFVANEDAGTATVTDLARRQPVVTMPVGIEPEGVAVSPDGRAVYVTAETSNTVSVIDGQTFEVVASFLVDVRPRAAAFSPSGERAYVTNEISKTVSVVDARRHEVIASVRLTNAAATPVGVAVSPDGGRVYVATGHGNSVAVIDSRTLEVVAEVPVGRRPWGIAVSADGRRIYTANGLTDDVSVIDAETLEVVRNIPVGRRPWGVALTP